MDKKLTILKNPKGLCIEAIKLEDKYTHKRGILEFKHIISCAFTEDDCDCGGYHIGFGDFIKNIIAINNIKIATWIKEEQPKRLIELGLVERKTIPLEKRPFLI